MIVRIKHALNDVQSMSHDGGKILKSLQNNYLPLIDIVVREAIQNSLDASIEGEYSTNVDFKVDQFESEKLASIFEEVDNTLLERYPSYQKFLAISDKKTYGLTGDYASEDIKVLNESNFHKLVFGIGKNQSKDGAGGSWGYGKTSYFRLGVGIVLYYTRIQDSDSDNYEERLIASIIEDPCKKKRLLPNNERGIAWWGEFKTDSDRIYPITNRDAIARILSIFGLKNYSDMETGTTIIIPYLNEFSQEIIDRDALKFPWESSYEDAIAMAVQRWYFPRIWNEQYREKLDSTLLECKVNNTVLHPSLEFEPVFKIYQELYTSALLGKPTTSTIQVQAINLGRNALQNSKEEVGYVAFQEVSEVELKMTPPDNKPSGLAYLGVKDKSLLEHNAPKVIAYSRKPGMVIEYCVNELWANGNINLKENHILLGFFVPNSNALLVDDFQKVGYKTLETYLRSIENSDHANWEDAVDITIVKRIRERTNQAITNTYQGDKDAENSSATSALSRKFGAMLLPPKNFGKTSSRNRDGQGIGETLGKTKSRGSDVSVIRSIPHNETKVDVVFKAFIKKNTNNNLFVQILTQDQRMDSSAWVKAMDNTIPYPFWISDVTIQKIDDEVINQSYKDYQSEEFIFNLDSNQSSVFEIISASDVESEIEGMLTLNMHSNHYVPNIAIRTL